MHDVVIEISGAESNLSKLLTDLVFRAAHGPENSWGSFDHF